MHHSEFIISREVLKKYRVKKELFNDEEFLYKANPMALIEFAREVSKETENLTSPVEIYALGMILEIQHAIMDQFKNENHFPIGKIYEKLSNEVGTDSLYDLMDLYMKEFPPTDIQNKTETIADYLSVARNRNAVLEDLLLLHLANQNPAIKNFKELIQAPKLTGESNYDFVLSKFIQILKEENIKNPSTEATLLESLNQPIKQSPNSLPDQLLYLLDQWGNILGKDIVSGIINEVNSIKKSMLYQLDDEGIQRDLPEMVFSKNDNRDDHYSPDETWMEKLVLLAKNCYVWLDQLSKQYSNPIQTLDQVPNEELDRISEDGFTGLWLIGLWERSIASREIKQMMGREDAVASAYSLMDYQISKDLGGLEALNNLKNRAMERGIRLSADMVPNHMGIDSKWVLKHPERFLSLEETPYPKYTFTGKDLSHDDNIGIYIEDHYFDRSDAAVVFKRVDRKIGDVRFIYHGNDGTAMPWNDTAQLDYLNPDVREEVIQEILEVAKNFPIIRFDAAMTLANEHIKRLWYPSPGEVGAIPSRSEHEMTIETFKKKMPKEFWREVVDRVTEEVPGTLLLAEAFWLMEGYFVRTLGMHRVYNSAFMHMLRNEDNDKFRNLIKNILEFDPQILKRFVNFMTNPDEKPAIEEFGAGNKYLGVCILLASMPGLPMFGHGQIEGFKEKYGMEYKKAYLEEIPNKDLLKVHKQFILPLLKQRKLFADVRNFIVYDFLTEEGIVDENVIAYSNCLANKNNGFSNHFALIVFHNKSAETSGWIKNVLVSGKNESGDSTINTLGSALKLNNAKMQFVIFREHKNNLEYIRSSNELLSEGLFLNLNAYQHHAFLDFRIVEDPNGMWNKVCEDLAGKGYWSIQGRYDEMFASPTKTHVNRSKNDRS
jgi:hypothetical protein